MTEEEYTFKVRALEKQRDGLSKIIKQAYKNLDRETKNIHNFETRIGKLKSLSIYSLTDDENSFAKFKTSLKKLNTELETSQEICTILETDVIPKKQDEFVEAQVAIELFQRSYLLECEEADRKKCEELRKKIEVFRQKNKE